MTLNEREIRKLAIIALFADDDLMDRFVLKGGNAIDIAYGLDSRASTDVDVSMESDFEPWELDAIKQSISLSLTSIFQVEGYNVIDYKFNEKPKIKRRGSPDWWGGYKIEFKLLEQQHGHLVDTNPQKASTMAAVTGPQNTKTFSIDISKREYCEKVEVKVDGYLVYVYTPKLLVFEKLRALCQQMEGYKLRSSEKSPRTADFYDIYILSQTQNLDFSHMDRTTLEKVFAAKEVPLALLKKIPDYRGFYEEGIEGLKSSLARDRLESFDFGVCFDFVLSVIAKILK